MGTLWTDAATLREQDRVDFKFSSAFSEVLKSLLLRCTNQIGATQDEQNERRMNDKMSAATTASFAGGTVT
jgi:hypothetical protein